jgi:FdhD protein
MRGTEQRDSARIVDSHSRRGPDEVVVESSLSITVTKPELDEVPLGITMRTPGSDRELVFGFLYSEGIIESAQDIKDIELEQGAALVKLADSSNFQPSEHVRNTTVTSSCGICGRSSISGLLHMHGPPLSEEITVDQRVVRKSLDAMSSRQGIFHSTGGSHACARFDLSGQLIHICEDVGRHNAMDKLVGSAIIEGDIPIADEFVVVSGRASFELVQKSLRAGFPMMVSIGAPSTLAIDMANEHGMTLACFAKQDSISVYSGLRRLSP